MDDYLFYTYFEDGRGYFVYKDLTFERSHKQRKRLPISGKPLAVYLFGHLADGRSV